MIAAAALSLFALLSGCGGSQTLEDVAESYKIGMSQNGPVVVFLPGTLASTLIDTETGERVWGLDDRLTIDPSEPEGLRRLSLPLAPVPSDIGAAPDAVRAGEPLRRAHESVLGIPISLAIYEDTLAAFRRAGLKETATGDIPASGPALVPFAYDWRRSITDAAQALGAALEARPPGAARVRLVGHSMGGLVALWYLMYGTAPLDSVGDPPPLTWAGARHVDRAVLVAPPLRGSAIAVRNSINGNKLAGPLVPVLPPAMLTSHPSTFELMPREDANTLRNEDGKPLGLPLMSAETWERMGWGMADPAEARNVAILARGAEDGPALAAARQAALIARGRAYHAAADRPLDPPEGLMLAVIAGTGSDTPSAVAVPPGGKPAEIAATGDGDGTVLLSSALAGFEDADTHPRKRAMAVEAGHMRILADSEVFNRVLATLTGEDRQ